MYVSSCMQLSQVVCELLKVCTTHRERHRESGRHRLLPASRLIVVCEARITRPLERINSGQTRKRPKQRLTRSLLLVLDMMNEHSKLLEAAGGQQFRIQVGYQTRTTTALSSIVILPIALPLPFYLSRNKLWLPLYRYITISDTRSLSLSPSA